MVEIDTSTPIDRIAEDVASLRELFARRLADDRLKRELLIELRERSTADDRVIVSRLLMPLALRIASVIDRVDSWVGPPDPLSESVADELCAVLADFGVEEVATTGEADPSTHRVVGAVETVDTAPGEIVSVRRRGYVLDGKVLRSADVIVAAAAGQQG